MQEIEICKAALKQWGPDAQTLMVFEEMSELQKELCKAARGKQNKDAIADEIADVYIMLRQMIVLHDCAAEVEEHKARKLERLTARIAEAQEATGRDYDEQDKHCRECICPSCDIFKTADCLYGPDGCKKCQPDSHVGHCWWHPDERGGAGLRFGKAYAIFANIESPDYTDEEKGAAILQILKMETHNSVTKAAMLNVIRYLLNLAFDVPEQ